LTEPSCSWTVSEEAKHVAVDEAGASVKVTFWYPAVPEIAAHVPVVYVVGVPVDVVQDVSEYKVTVRVEPDWVNLELVVPSTTQLFNVAIATTVENACVAHALST
jgi:hypothetical protein